MTRPLVANDFDAIRERQREIAAENGLAAPGEICTCPPGPLVIPGCPVHKLEFEHLLSACDCPTDHDVQGVYRKVHVPGCLAHFGSPAEIAAYRHWVASAHTPSGLAHVWSPEEILAYRRWQTRTAPAE